MIDRERVLQPLRERGAAIDRLDTYASAGELADAIVSVYAALDRSVRLLLRTDEGAPESARMGALSGAVSLDTVITELRRRDRIGMELAGRLHEAEGIVRRVREGGEPLASDGDTLRTAVRLLESIDGAEAPPETGAERPAFALEESAQPVEAERSRPPILTAVVIALLVLLGVSGWLMVRGRSGPAGRQAAIEAFRAGDLAVARTELEAVLADRPDDVTALLYLARIHRRDGRPDDAAAALRAAVDHAPGDPDVRRELGWLFMDLGRPEPAAEQFRLARDAEPDEPNNWIGLVRALREANDPSAAEVLRQAPPAAQAALGPAAR